MSGEVWGLAFGAAAMAPGEGAGGTRVWHTKQRGRSHSYELHDGLKARMRIRVQQEAVIQPNEQAGSAMDRRAEAHGRAVGGGGACMHAGAKELDWQGTTLRASPSLKRLTVVALKGSCFSTSAIITACCDCGCRKGAGRLVDRVSGALAGGTPGTRGTHR